MKKWGTALLITLAIAGACAMVIGFVVGIVMFVELLAGWKPWLVAAFIGAAVFWIRDGIR